MCLPRHYPRVLNSQAQLTSISWDASAWLARYFLPYLATAGIERVAWVSGRSTGRSTGGHDVVHDVLHRLPLVPVTFFDDVEMAVDWLQRSRPAQPRPGPAPGECRNAVAAGGAVFHALGVRARGLARLCGSYLALGHPWLEGHPRAK